jgi:predicted MFS family arabinose efflux permease
MASSLVDEWRKSSEAYTPTTNYNSNEKDSLVPLEPFSSSTKHSIWSVRLLSILSFVSNVGASSIPPSLWFRISKIYDSTPAFVGLAISLYAFGHMLGSALHLYLFQSLPNKARLFLIFSFFLVFFGDFLYFIAPELFVIFIGRFISGFGTGGQDMIQEYVFVRSQIDRQSSAVTHLSLFSAASLVIGPLVTAAFSFIPTNDWIDNSTIPGLISAALSLFCALVLCFVKIAKSKEEEDLRINTFDTSEPNRVVPSMPLLVIFIIVYFSIFMGSPVFETLVVPYTITCYTWNVFYNSLLFAAAGAVSVVSLISLEFCAEFVSELIVSLPSLIILGFGYFILVPLHGGTSPCEIGTNVPVTGCECDGTDLNTGHNYYVPLWRFICGAVVIVVAYNLSFASLGKSYSKFLYWMSSEQIEHRLSALKNVGYFAAVVGPLWMSYSLESWGSAQTFILFVSLSWFACIVLLALFRNYSRIIDSVSGRNITYSFVNEKKSAQEPSLSRPPSVYFTNNF